VRELVDVVLGRSWQRESPWHGETHWRCVAATGIALAQATPGADVRLAFLFGLLHDTRRANEGVDPQHGPRAAAFARELYGEGLPSLAPPELARLARAIELHAAGRVDDDPTTGVCWDADRLHLPRVGIRLDPRLLSTRVAGTDGWLARAASERERPPGWDEVLARLARVA
jgi:uncharacterized protein